MAWPAQRESKQWESNLWESNLWESNLWESKQWEVLEDVEPALARWPAEEMVRLIDDGDEIGLRPDPVLVVERALGRALTAGERGLLMMKVLAPVGTGFPAGMLRSTFRCAAESAEPWAAAVVAGAGALATREAPADRRG